MEAMLASYVAEVEKDTGHWSLSWFAAAMEDTQGSTKWFCEEEEKEEEEVLLLTLSLSLKIKKGNGCTRLSSEVMSYKHGSFHTSSVSCSFPEAAIHPQVFFQRFKANWHLSAAVANGRHRH